MAATAEFCTLVDAAYMAHWLALHRSMTRHGGDIRFRVCCMDDEAEKLLNRLAIPGVTAMPVSELEASDPELAAVRDERWFRAYRSTAKPCLCRYMLDRDPDLDTVVYLDADLMFFGDPSAVLDELGEHAVLLVPHNHPPERRHDDEVYGAYNGGTVAFRRGPEADRALGWWRDRCLEWCSLEPQPGRWADQRYLHDLPERFPGVHATRNPGVGPGPWSEARGRLQGGDGGVSVDGRTLVFYHYSGLMLAGGSAPALRLLALTPGSHFVSGPVPLGWAQPYVPHAADATERRLAWEPYLRELSAALASIRELDPGYRGSLRSPWQQFVEVALRKRVLYTGLWALRRLLARRGATRLVGSVDRWRARWRVE